MQKGNGNIYIKIMINLIIHALGILFLIFVVPKIIRFFIPFVIGWIISIIANPLVKFLEKKVKIVRKHSSAIIIITTIAAIIGLFYGLIHIAIKELTALADDLPNIITYASLKFDQVSKSLSGVAEILPEGTQDLFNQIIPGIKNQISTFLAGERISKFTIDFAKNFVDWFIMTVIVFLSSYFFIKDRDIMAKEVRKKVPRPIMDGYNLVIYNFKTAIGGYFKAQFKIMFVLILIMFVGFELIEVPYSFLLASLTAFLDLLPVLGTGAILWPWALTEVLLGNYISALSLLSIYLICQVVKNVLQPKMVGDSIGINPLATLLFMYIGYEVMGVFGMIIAIPIGMVVVNFFRMGMFNLIIRGFKILIHDINEYRKF